MKVKAQGLLNAAKLVEERAGREALAEILRACSPETRETFTSAVALNWHPVEELCEFVDVAERVLAPQVTGSLDFAREVGMYGARANMKGVLLRFGVYFGKPEFLIQRAAGLWRQYNDEGEMKMLLMNDTLWRIEVAGIAVPRNTFCRIITGWCHECAVAFGVAKVVARHVECRALGGQACLYEVEGDVRARDVR
jgi:hypothetical protein